MIDVSPQYLEAVKAILRRHVPDREVWVTSCISYLVMKYKGSSVRFQVGPPCCT
jgi:hypothetical protein